MKEKNLICFDVDGVLISSETTHFLSMKEALQKNASFDLEEGVHDRISSLSTVQKIHWLEENHGLFVTDEIIKNIKIDKFELIEKYDEYLEFNYSVKDAIQKLSNDFNFALVSNARTEYVRFVSKQLGIEDFVVCIGNDLGIASKPRPDMYINAMQLFQTDANKTLIFEDSDVGLAAAYASGAHVHKVENFERFNSAEVLDAVLTTFKK